MSITGHAKRVESPTASIVFAFDMEIDYDENRVIYGVPASTSLALIVGESEKDIDSRFYYDFVVELVDGNKFRIQQGRVMVYRAITKVTP